MHHPPFPSLYQHPLILINVQSRRDWKTLCKLRLIYLLFNVFALVSYQRGSAALPLSLERLLHVQSLIICLERRKKTTLTAFAFSLQTILVDFGWLKLWTESLNTKCTFFNNLKFRQYFLGQYTPWRRCCLMQICIRLDHNSVFVVAVLPWPSGKVRRPRTAAILIVLIEI